MASLTTTSIRIADKKIDSYEHLRIEQEIGEHHILTLHCRISDLLENPNSVAVGSKEYLGAKIIVSIEEIRKGKEDQKPLEFKGIVTSITEPVALYNEEIICITAYSATILAEQGKKYTSYTDVELSHIVRETLQGIDTDKLSFDLNLRTQNAIPYSVQYNESDFEYLKRLSQYHNEWLYYDGKQIVMGSPSTEVVELVHKKNLKSFNFHLSFAPNNTTYLTHDYHTGEMLQKETSEVTTSGEHLNSFIQNKTNELFRKSNTILDSNVYHSPNMVNTFDKKVSDYTKAIAASQVIFSGASDHTGVQLGKIMLIKNQGRYRVTKVIHVNTSVGNYENHFEAVDQSIEVYPKMNINATPVAVSEFAEVTDNNDPEKMGRIRVRFSWQTSETAPWLRIVSPYAGQNRGFHFLPEIGDTVLVNYENNNAERPFILGAVRNMTSKPHDSLPNESNDKKALESKMELSLIFDDNQNNPKLKLTDNENLEIVIDKQAKKIGIHAVGDIEMIGDNIKLCAKDSIVLESQNQHIKGNEINISATQKAVLMSNNTTQIKSRTVEHIMGAAAQSPSYSMAMEVRPSSPTTQIVSQSTSQNQTQPEEEEESQASIDSVTLYDENGNETEVLSDASLVSVETTEMTNENAHIKFHDPDTQLDIDLGHFSVPKTPYTIEIPYHHDTNDLEE